jgi:hypothetical protein
MKINRDPINSDVVILKDGFNRDMKRISKSMDYTKKGYITPIVMPTITTYLCNHHSKLNKCTRILAQDCILNEFTFTINNKDDYNPEEIERQTEILNNFWNSRNKIEFYRACIEKNQYGYGVCEVIFKNQQPVGLKQFPAQTASIREINDNYYAVQEADGETKYRLTRAKYDEIQPQQGILNTVQTDGISTCLWLGGDTTSDFYDTPAWVPAFSHIIASITLDDFNVEKLNNGNLLDGVLTFTGPQVHRPDKKTMDQLIKQELKDVGTGLLTLSLESNNPQMPLDVKYIPIGNNNYDYLEKLKESSDQEILSAFDIPKIREMIDDSKESMNSNKNDVIFQIYNITLEAKQTDFEIAIENFNKKYLSIDATLNIQTPQFNDKTSIEVGMIKDLFNNALITIGQAVELIKPFLTSIDWSNVDTEAPFMNERFYNGASLGLTSVDPDEDLLDTIMDFIGSDSNGSLSSELEPVS